MYTTTTKTFSMLFNIGEFNYTNEIFTKHYWLIGKNLQPQWRTLTTLRNETYVFVLLICNEFKYDLGHNK